jgi:hypothetical protein
MFDHETHNAMIRVAIAWIGAIAGITISQWAAVAALVYSCLQIYITVRDKLIRKGKKNV